VGFGRDISWLAAITTLDQTEAASRFRDRRPTDDKVGPTHLRVRLGFGLDLMHVLMAAWRRRP